MITYLKFRTGGQTYSDGTSMTTLLMIKKTRPYGKVVEEKNISKKLPILITGLHGAGKSKTMHKLYNNYYSIWRFHRTEPLFITSARLALSSWFNAASEKWIKKKLGVKTLRGIPQEERLELLIEFVKTKKCLVFIEDANKLTGRKLEIAIRLLNSTKIFILSAASENRLAPTLRQEVLNRKPQIIRLSSRISYDFTKQFIFIIAILAAIGGWPELALVLGAGNLLVGGRFGSKDK